MLRAIFAVLILFAGSAPLLSQPKDKEKEKEKEKEKKPVAGDKSRLT